MGAELVERHRRSGPADVRRVGHADDTIACGSHSGSRSSASRAASGQKIGAATQHDAYPALGRRDHEVLDGGAERQEGHAPLRPAPGLVRVAVEPVPREAAEHDGRRAGDLGVRRGDELVDRAPAATPSPVRSARQRSPIPAASCCLASSVSTTTHRHGREWCGAGAMHAASTNRRARRAAPGRGGTARIDRRAARNAGRAGAHRRGLNGTGRRPGRARARARCSPATTPGRGRARWRPARPADLPITSSAAAATSSATATSVTCSSRPSASVVPRRSTTAARPATPMATSVRPVAPGAPERVGDDHRDLDPPGGPERVADAPGRPVGVDGQQRGPSVVDVREVDPRVGAHEPVRGLADDEVAAPPEDAHRLLSRPAPGAAARSSGSTGTSRPSAFDTTFWVTTMQSPSSRGVPWATAASASSGAKRVVGADLGDAVRSGSG